MAKRSSKPDFQSKLTRGVLVLAGCLLLVTWLLSLLGSFADRLVSSRHPEIRQTIVLLGLLAIVSSVLLVWQKFNARRRTQQRDLVELLALTPTQFEHAVSNLLRDLGFRNVTHVGGSSDLGADLKATDKSGQQVVVQCKRLGPGTRIGSPDIQKFIGMAIVHHRAHRGIFVTTADFTAPAVALAAQHPIELWDGFRLSAALAKVNGRRLLAS